MDLDPDLHNIYACLKACRGVDVTSYRPSVMEGKITGRMEAVGCGSTSDYLRYLMTNPGEFELLISALTVNVSRFFRNAMTFEFICNIVLSDIFLRKREANDRSVRIWSAGCAAGEEPYSLAILINEKMETEKEKFDIGIFATDIDEFILEKAKEGVYSFESVKEVKYGHIRKYFSICNDRFKLDSDIINQVNFSKYDLFHPKTYAPPESVFGGFDLILCRNVLIYFQSGFQEIIFDKLMRSLSVNGYLVLGKTETLPSRFRQHADVISEYCHVYKKINNRSPREP